MKQLVFPIAQSKKSISLIINSNNLKNPIKILYPNKMIVNIDDIDKIKKLLDRNYLNYK